MAKQTLTVQLMHAQKRIAELEAQLTNAHLLAKMAATKTVAPAPKPIATVMDAPGVKVTCYFDRDGQLWEQTTRYQGQCARTTRRPVSVAEYNAQPL